MLRVMPYCLGIKARCYNLFIDHLKYPLDSPTQSYCIYQLWCYSIHCLTYAQPFPAVLSLLVIMLVLENVNLHL